MSEQAERFRPSKSGNGFVICWTHAAGMENHVADFRAYDVLGETSEPTPGSAVVTQTLLFKRKGSTRSGDYAETVDEAEVLIEGRVKFDGCADVTVTPGEQGYLHLCGQRDARDFAALLVYLWDSAAKRLDRHLEDMQ